MTVPKLPASVTRSDSDLMLPSLSVDPAVTTAYISVPPAQNQSGVFDEDKVFDDIRGGFDNFIQSGQVWALLIGIVVGYGIRSITK